MAKNVNRLTAIKDVAHRFIAGGDGLEGRFAGLGRHDYFCRLRRWHCSSYFGPPVFDRAACNDGNR